MCAPPPPAVPPPTAAAILEITVAPTQDIDATATVYARELIPTPTPAGLYVVQPGDTLSTLANDFGTTVEEIMAANQLSDPDSLQVGQPLIIPSLISGPPRLSASETPAPPAGARTVQPPGAGESGATPVPTLSTP